MSLRIGDAAPDFTANTTQGEIAFHQWLGDSWGVLFSHPKDFTPVCSTELGYLAQLFLVILPQAVRRVAPPLLNDFVALQKDVALVSILGPQEAFRIAQIIQGENFNYTPLIAAAILYLAITVPLARVVDRIGGGPEGAVR